jgi:hypothetical protein
MKLNLRTQVGKLLLLVCFLFSATGQSFFVSIDPNALNLGSHSAHEELTRQAYEYLQEQWKIAGSDHRAYLEEDLEALYNISRGVYATDVPNGKYIISLPDFWQFPNDILQWHNNPFGQHLHSLRNRTDDKIHLESALEACLGTKKDILNVVAQAFDYLAANKKTEFLFLVGHGLHIIQDSFSSAHTRRQNTGNYNLTDLCYYGERQENESACFHEENDERDQIWLMREPADLFALTKKEWAVRGESVKAFKSIDKFDLIKASEKDKRAYLKHEARLAKIATIKFLKLNLELLLEMPKGLLKDEGAREDHKRQFINKITKLLEVETGEKVGVEIKTYSYDKIMSEGIMKCSDIKK